MKQILVPRFDSLGDVILLHGFLQEVLRQRQDVSLTLLVRESVLQLKSLCDPRMGWLSTPLNPYLERPEIGLSEELETLIRTGGWDEIWFTARSRTWADPFLAYRFSGSKQIQLGRLADPPPRLARILRQLGSTAAPYNTQVAPVEEGQHELRNLRALLVPVLGTTNPPPLQPSLVVPADAQAEADAWLAREGLEAGRFVVCVPAGSENVGIKGWPIENYARLVTWLECHQGLPVVLAGHRAESETTEKVGHEAESLGSNPRVWTGGGGDIAVLAALLARSRFYFGNDTGPMHLAASLSIPVAAVFGGGTWPRFVPAGKASVAVRPMPCFGCGWDCCFGVAPCIRELPVQTVEEMIKDLLARIDSPDRTVRIFEAPRYTAGAERFIQLAAEQYRALQQVRARQLEEVECVLEDSEADRAARLGVIHEQGLRIAQMDEEIRLLNKLLREHESETKPEDKR